MLRINRYFLLPLKVFEVGRLLKFNHLEVGITYMRFTFELSFLLVKGQTHGREPAKGSYDATSKEDIARHLHVLAYSIFKDKSTGISGGRWALSNIRIEPKH